MSDQALIEPGGPLPPLNPLALIQQALAAGMDPDKLGKLMDLEERWTRNRAADTFAEAITGFQRECPQIEKLKAVQDKYTYAPYEQVMRVAGPIMVRHGIVATFSIENEERAIKITCRIRVGVHQEVTTLTVPVPEGNKLVNSAQLMGQAVSYAKRYALCAALNIVTRDEDKDSADLLDTLIADEVLELEAAMESKNMPLPAFLTFARAESLESIPRSQFARLLDAIKRTKRKEAAQ